MFGTDALGQHSGKAEEQQVSSLHKRSGQAVAFGNFDIGARQRIRCQLIQQAHIKHGLLHALFLGDLCRAFYFKLMALAIIKGYGFHFGEAFLRPEQAGGAVLTTAENNDRFFILSIKTSHPSYFKNSQKG